MNTKKVSSQDKINKLIYEIDKNVKNQSLYDYIIFNINNILNKNKISILQTENGILIKNKKNDDLFEIRFEPNIETFNRIIVKRNYFNNKAKVIKKIEYNDNIVVVKEENLDKIVYQKTNKISSTSKKIVERKYMDNALIYQHKVDLTVNFIEKQCHFDYLEEEMYIFNKKAVKKNYIIKDNIENNLYYSKTNFCDEPDFNTREISKKIYSYGMQPATEEEYNNFIFLNKSKKKKYKL